MPAFPGTSGLPHAAVLWPALHNQFDDLGDPVVSPTPVQISCWKKHVKESTPIKLETLTNNTVVDDEVVVDRVVANGSRMWLGTLLDWLANKRLGPILAVKEYSEKSDATTGQVTTRTVKLMRYTNG